MKMFTDRKITTGNSSLSLTHSSFSCLSRDIWSFCSISKY